MKDATVANGKQLDLRFGKTTGQCYLTPNTGAGGVYWMPDKARVAFSPVAEPSFVLLDGVEFIGLLRRRQNGGWICVAEPKTTEVRVR